jgi:hypothetical protein
MDKPSSLNSSSYHSPATGRTKAVFKSANDRRGRKPNGVNSEFDRILEAQDEQLQRSGSNTITSDRITRRQSHDIL